MPWLKLNTDIFDNPKIARLNPEQFRLWIACLVLARSSKHPGRLMVSEKVAVTAEDVAIKVRSHDVTLAIGAMDLFVQMGMLHRDGEVYVVTGFDEHQWKHPSDKPAATRARKEKERSGRVTSMSRACHDAIPRPSRVGHDTDTESDKEEEEEEEEEKEQPHLSASLTAGGFSPSLNRGGAPPIPERDDQIGMFPATALPPAVKPPDPVALVFDAWRESASPNAKLDDKRRKAIQDGLKLYPAGDLVDAVRGWRHDPFSRGENDRQRKYNELTLLLRDAAHIEKFRDLEQQHRPKPVITSELSEQTKERIRLYEAARQRRQAGRWQAQA